MPNVVLIAKSTYVWLEQLSKKYGRHIHRLDHIPDEELRLLAHRGITRAMADWPVGAQLGVAGRSSGCAAISDAVASAYSLKDYRIADDLGGNGSVPESAGSRRRALAFAWPATWCRTTWASIRTG